MPTAVIGLVGLLGGEHTTQIFAEISGEPFLVVHTVIFQFQRQRLEGVALGFRNISRFPHLVEHHIAPPTGTFVVAHRIIKRRILAHAHQRSRFLNLQILRFATEIGKSSSLDTYRIVQEVELVEVHGEDFLFCIVTFQLYGNHPFDRLLKQTLHHIVGAGRIKLFGKLLGDGTATAGVLLHQDTTLHHGTRQSVGINARMLGKAYVFRSNQGIDDIGRQLIVAHKHTIFLTIGISTQYFSIIGKDFCGKFVIRILQILHRRHIAYPALGYGKEYKDTHQRNQCDKNP